MAFLGGTSRKGSSCQCWKQKRGIFDPRAGKVPWRRKWQPTPVFLPGKSHGRRSWWATVHGASEHWTRLSVRVRAHTHTHTHTHTCTHGHVSINLYLQKRKWSESHSVMSDSLWPCGLYSPWNSLQVRILEWVAFPFSRGSSQSRDWTQVSHIAGRFFASWATMEAKKKEVGDIFGPWATVCLGLT